MKRMEQPIAHEMAKRQREIGVAEFFSRNRHLLGFDSKRKALLTTIKEAVDNSLDACEEAEILPEIHVEVIDMGSDRFRVIVEDNGPGIVKKQIPNIFARLLYGSKFFKLAQSRGQQGIGISASVLYAQLTTGKPARIISKISPNDPAHYYELKIDTQKNQPLIMTDEVKEWSKELGTLMDLLRATKAPSVQSFFVNEFSRVGHGTAKQICQGAAILPSTKPAEINRDMAEKLIKSIQATKIVAPPTDCISPIGAELLEKGLKKEINAEFYCAATRPPNVYRGNPFVIEAGFAYGGEQLADKSVSIYRFANRVPLLYQQGACASAKAVMSTNWRSYGLSQSQGSLPIGPLTIAIHIASVWVPFTSESKEAIAHYPEIIREMRLALQEVGRQLGSYISKKRRMHAESKKRDYIQTYIPHVSDALKEILGFSDSDKETVEKMLVSILEKHRGELKDVAMENTEYNEEFARIGKGKTSDDDDGEERSADNGNGEDCKAPDKKKNAGYQQTL